MNISFLDTYSLLHPLLGAMSWMLDILLFHAFTTFHHAYVTYVQETSGRLIDSFVTRTVDVFTAVSPFLIVTYDIEHLAPLSGLDLTITHN